jgi:protein-disulfide isomerase
MCALFNKIIHRAARDFKNIRIEHHSLPLDLECNKHLQQPFHNGSCVAARYAEAAHIQGKFWEVNSLFFDEKPDTEEKIIEVIEKANFGIDMDKLKEDANSKEVEAVIQKDIDYAAENMNLGTPIIKVGEDFEMGIPHDGYPGLKRWIIQYGGKKKGLF